jgi:hypothetical protein
MSTSATIPASPLTLRDSMRSLLLRAALVPLFVALCYLFPWWTLRAVTTSTLAGLSALVGLPMLRIGRDLIALDRMHIQFIIPCTMVDAFFGAIPLLWRSAENIPRNMVRLAAVFAGVFVLNIVRLEAGFFAIHQGAPWWLAHECVAGVAYFCLFWFIVRERAWAPNPGE